MPDGPVLDLDDIDVASNRVANGLLWRLGPHPAEVALVFDDAASLATVVLGAVKAGMTPLIVDHREQLDDTGVRLVVTDPGAAPRAFPMAGPACTVVLDSALVEGASATRPAPAVPPVEPPMPARHQRPLGDEGSELVQLQAGRPDVVPLFVVHDIDGRSNRYRRLAIELGDDQPVYGFDSPFLLGYPVPVADAAELAERYAREIVLVQPEGPYQLAGSGFGGILAYEVAARLEARGRVVSFLGVIDAGPRSAATERWRRRPPPSPWLGLRPPADPRWPWRRRVRYYGSIAKRTPSAFLRHVAKRTGFDRYTLAVEWAVDLRRHGRVRASTRPWYSWHRLWELCGRDWAPSPRRGDLCLFWSADQSAPDPALGWAEHVEGELTVRPLRITHDELFDDDHVARLAAEVARGLAAGARRQAAAAADTPV